MEYDEKNAKGYYTLETVKILLILRVKIARVVRSGGCWMLLSSSFSVFHCERKGFLDFKSDLCKNRFFGQCRVAETWLLCNLFLQDKFINRVYDLF